MHIGPQTLKDYACGHLPVEEARLVEDHLEQCAACGEALDQLDCCDDPFLAALRSGLKQWPGNLDPGATTLKFSTGSQSGTVTCASSAISAGQRFGRYEVCGELGRGGMGIVFRAIDPTLRRQVALKLIAEHRFAKPEDRSRFRREAESAARLQHANIVQVFEFGEHEDKLFCAFELVDGGSLADRIARRPLPPAEAALVVATLADATEYAHRRQVIHRDLKPANILFTTDDTPKIADFGLAKRLDEPLGQTAAGTLLGSPSYMAPEQAAGNSSRVGRQTDVYALGTILYESLTGQAPFQADSLLAMLDHVRHSEPKRPSSLRRGLPGDLEAVCLKCLEKEPARRYATAADLAADLRRYLAGLPVLARKPTWLQRIVKRAKRHPTAAAAFALAVALLTTIGFWIREQHKFQVAQENRRREQYAATLRDVASLHDQDPLGARRTLDDPLACPPDLRDFAWGQLYSACDRESGAWDNVSAALCIAATRSGGQFATGDATGSVRIWSTNSKGPPRESRPHQAPVTSIEFSPDNETLATTGEDGTIVLQAVKGEREIFRLSVEGGRVNDASYSADGKWLATAHSSGLIRIWNPTTGERLQDLANHGPHSVHCVAFNDDNRCLASGSSDGKLLLWQTESWTPHLPKTKHNGAVISVAFRPGALERLTWAAGDQRLYYWDVNNFWQAPALPDDDQPQLLDTPSGFGGGGDHLAFSLNGELLAAGNGNQSIQFWRAADGAATIQLNRLGSSISALAFDSEGELLAATQDGKIHRWRANPNQTLKVAAHSRPITGLKINENKQIFSSSDDGTLAVSPLGSPAARQVALGEHGKIGVIGWDAKGQTCAWEHAGRLFTASFADVLEPNVRELKVKPFTPIQFAISQRRQTLLMADYAGLKEISLNDGSQQDWPLSGSQCLAHCPLTDQIAIGCEGNQINWRLPNMGKFRSFATIDDLRCLAFSADGRRLAVGAGDARPDGSFGGRLAVHELSTGTILYQKDWLSPVSCVQFSPDGKTLAVGDQDGKILLCDATNGMERSILKNQRHVLALEFAADSSLLASGDDEGVIRLWPAAVSK